MADHPEAEQSTTVDRTSALVASGLVLIAVLGVFTVFSDAIAAAWSPNATTNAAGVTSTLSAPATPEPAIATPAAPASAGAGGSS